MPQSKASWRRRVGRVTVYRRGTRYWIYYRQGRQIRKPVGTNRDDALALAAKVNAQLAEGAPTLLAFQPIDLKGLIAKWLDHHEHIRRSSLATVRRYGTAARHLANHVDGAYGKIRADRFDSSGAERFVRYLRTIKVSPNGQVNTKKRRMRDKGVVFVLGHAEPCSTLPTRSGISPPTLRIRSPAWRLSACPSKMRSRFGR